jgi:hypothetical protein
MKEISEFLLIPKNKMRWRIMAFKQISLNQERAVKGPKKEPNNSLVVFPPSG